MEMWIAAAIFAALMLALSLYVLSLSGHFPPEHRAPALQGAAGTSVMAVSAALAVVALTAGIAAGWHRMPLVAMIIGGGAGMLLAPLVLTNFSDRFVNGRGALVAFSGAAALCAIAIYQVQHY